MRATSVMRFVIFGAIGFGIGGGIAGSFTVNPVGHSLLALLLLFLGLGVIGTLGGASLGLAMRDRRKAMVLALWGAAGFGLGFFVAVIGLVFALLLGGAYIHWPASFYMEYGFLTAVAGAVGGVSLGAALRSRRSILALALAGFVGFGIGDMLGLPGITEVLQGLLAGERYNPTLFAVTQVVGGASLGAALGYLESCEMAVEQGHESDEHPRNLGARRYPFFEACRVAYRLRYRALCGSAPRTLLWEARLPGIQLRYRGESGAGHFIQEDAADEIVTEVTGWA